MTTSKVIPGILFLCYTAQAQETPGLINSNYFVSSGFAVNPSTSADAKTFIQYNLVAADAYLGNNLVYLSNYKLSLAGIRTAQLQEPAFDLSKRPKFAAAMASVEGPAFVLSKNNFGLGFFVRARAEADFKAGNAIEAGSLLLQDIQNVGSTSVNLRNTRAAAMAWSEIGLNYAYIVKKNRNSIFSVGANLKALVGAAYAYANITRFEGFYNDSLIQVNKLDAAYRYTTLDYRLGKGIGADIGFTYKRMNANPRNYFANAVRCNCEQMDYKYLVTMTLHDVGAVRYLNGNAGSYATSGTYYTDRNDSSYQTTLSEVSSLSADSKKIFSSLPTEFITRFDYNFGNKIYLSANLYKNLVPAAISGVRGSNLFQLAPRFELKRFEFSMPLSFIDFKKPVTGLFVRLGGFGIGTDNLAPFFYTSNVSKAGLYFKWTLSLYKNPACKPKRYKLADCPTNILKSKK